MNGVRAAIRHGAVATTAEKSPIAWLTEALVESCSPAHLWIFDDSAAHRGHPGARSGAGHYRVRVVASSFAGETRVARHRRIYEAVGSGFATRLHALQIEAWTPAEWANRNVAGETCDCLLCARRLAGPSLRSA